MKPPENFTVILNRKRYSTKTATLLAGDDWWDGHNFERQGRQRFLYRTPRGVYFILKLSQWQGEPSTQLTRISQDEAIALFETTLPEHRVEYNDAFPDVVVEDA